VVIKNSGRANNVQFGAVYGKPATGLNILEKPLWVKLFDHAFKGICKQMEIQASYSWGLFLEPWKMLLQLI
jgi:hypothetical protein